MKYLILILLIPTIALAHSGRTDANGGHYNRSTGEYHCHSCGTSPVKTDAPKSEPVKLTHWTVAKCIEFGSDERLESLAFHLIKKEKKDLLRLLTPQEILQAARTMAAIRAYRAAEEYALANNLMDEVEQIQDELEATLYVELGCKDIEPYGFDDLEPNGKPRKQDENKDLVSDPLPKPEPVQARKKSQSDYLDNILDFLGQLATIAIVLMFGLGLLSWVLKTGLLILEELLLALISFVQYLQDKFFQQ